MQCIFCDQHVEDLGKGFNRCPKCKKVYAPALPGTIKIDSNMVSCTLIGLSFSTRPFIKKIGRTKYEARVGIAILGSCNCMPDDSPFDLEFNGNYCQGIGTTPMAATFFLFKDIVKMANSLW